MSSTLPAAQALGRLGCRCCLPAAPQAAVPLLAAMKPLSCSAACDNVPTPPVGDAVASRLLEIRITRAAIPVILLNLGRSILRAQALGLLGLKASFLLCYLSQRANITCVVYVPLDSHCDHNPEAGTAVTTHADTFLQHKP